jgi:hypothetical protein
MRPGLIVLVNVLTILVGQILVSMHEYARSPSVDTPVPCADVASTPATVNPA